MLPLPHSAHAAGALEPRHRHLQHPRCAVHLRRQRRHRRPRRPTQHSVEPLAQRRQLGGRALRRPLRASSPRGRRRRPAARARHCLVERAPHCRRRCRPRRLDVAPHELFDFCSARSWFVVMTSTSHAPITPPTSPLNVTVPPVEAGPKPIRKGLPGPHEPQGERFVPNELRCAAVPSDHRLKVFAALSQIVREGCDLDDPVQPIGPRWFEPRCAQSVLTAKAEQSVRGFAHEHGVPAQCRLARRMLRVIARFGEQMTNGSRHVRGLAGRNIPQPIVRLPPIPRI